MSEPAQAPPVHCVEVAPGVKVDSTMTAEQRGAIVAKAHGVTLTERPRASLFPVGHTDATVSEMARRESLAAPKATPVAKPAAPVVEPQGTPAEREAAARDERGRFAAAPREANPEYMARLVEV